MKNKQFRISFVIIALLCAFQVSCSDYGKKIEYPGGELYYTDKVSEDDAKKLGEFLVAEKFFKTENPIKISVQLSKEQDTYLFRMVSKEGISLDDTKYTDGANALTGALSVSVFNNANVNFQYCDKNFKTIKEIPFQKPELYDTIPSQNDSVN